MALVTDFLTAEEFADQIGEPLIPIARDVTRAIGVVNMRENWGLVPGALYEDLTAVQKGLVDAEAQQYAKDRVAVYIAAAVRNVAKEVRRPFVDRLLAGNNRLAVVPPRDRHMPIFLEVQDFVRFADYGTDQVYPFEYYLETDGNTATGRVDSGFLEEQADVLFPESLRVVRDTAGEWPADLDTNRECYFSVWVGVSKTDADFPLWRQAVLSVANALRGDEEGRPYPFQKTVRSILGLKQ